MVISFRSFGKKMCLYVKRRDICMSVLLTRTDVDKVRKEIDINGSTKNIFVRKVDEIENVKTGINILCNDKKVKLYFPGPVFEKIVRGKNGTKI